MKNILCLAPGESVADFLAALRQRPWRAVVVSLAHELVDEKLVERIAAEPAAGAVVLTTATPSLRASLWAQRAGAMGVLPEPWDEQQLGDLLGPNEDAEDIVAIPRIDHRTRADQMVGQSRVMADVFTRIAHIAASESTVLVTGESGTGKELVARALHDASPRAAEPFVAVNCAAIPDALLESELFGHEKGAFTGAVARRRGRFERANRGTIFLDEIGDMSLVLQGKLLRVLEERVVERVGGDEEHAVDVRVVAATHRDLSLKVNEGSFREDLFFRLQVLDVHLPALRTRSGDLPLLAHHFAASFALRHGRSIQGITRDAMEALEEHPWPGNVRELRNVMDRAVLLTQGSVIGRGALRLGAASPSRAPINDRDTGIGYPTDASLAFVEADHIRRVLEANRGQVGIAAGVLGLHRNTLTRKIREFRLNEPEREMSV